MIKWISNIKNAGLILLSILLLTSCASTRGSGQESAATESKRVEGRSIETIEPLPSEPNPIKQEKPESNITESGTTEGDIAEPETTESDWSEYFDGLNGTAVLYDASNKHFMIYQKELALTQSSPCSTFKIISSMIALENGIIQPEDSTYAWSKEVFWNENWNQDMDFRQAFSNSCVWYFRKVIDEIGQERMQEALEKLSYGNCDISDWEGRWNTNNNNRALTGFWIESSLKISPKEQTEMMERIFGEDSICSEETRKELKNVMQVTAEDIPENRLDISLYGKTGMGKAGGQVVDAWFTGFAENRGQKLYFCVHLGRNDGRNVSSTLAKEIAIQIVLDEYKRQ